MSPSQIKTSECICDAQQERAALAGAANNGLSKVVAAVSPGSTLSLSPCPFCGSLKSELVSGSYEIDGVKTTTQNVLCGNCNAMGPDTLMGEDRAVEMWNRRRS